MTITVPTWIVVVAAIGYFLSLGGAFASLWNRFSRFRVEITADAALNSLGASLMGIALLVTAIYFRK